jgi:hypothetical protein
MSEQKQPARVRGLFPIVGMVIQMTLTIAVSPFMGLLGVASLVCQWGAKHFGRTL